MKITKHIIGLLVLLTTYSCNDYLEIVPYSFSSPDNFYKTEAEAELSLTGVYNILTATSVQGEGNQSTFSRQLMFMLNGATDECFWQDGRSDADYGPWGLAGFTTENKFINEVWFFLYAGINRANYLLEKLSNIDDFSGNRKLEIEGEAKLLRGLYHMYLSMIHGAIPVYTTFLQDPAQERQSLQNVYDQIIQDYKFAYENLPDRATVLSHANKWTAAALLAKVYTYLGSAKKTGVSDFGFSLNSFDWVDADDCYQKALQYTNEIIENSGYELIDNYDYLFRETTKEHQYKECLLTAEACSDASQNVVNVLINAFIPQGNRDLNGGGYSWYRPTGELYLTYSDKDIRRDHNLTRHIKKTPEWEEIDGYRYAVPIALTNTNTNTYCIGKYRMIDPAQKNINLAMSFITLPLIRYADVLLLHAEALYFNGRETEAREFLTMVRQRALLENESIEELNEDYKKSDFIEELLDERTRELCFENWRRIDLARFNKYDQKINALSLDAGYFNTVVPSIKQNWKAERIWIPIPIQQIDLNSNLVQNPGY